MSEQTVLPETVPDVRKSVTVPRSAQDCFTAFTEQGMGWWPPHHILVKKERVALVFEPRLGGRYYERDIDGLEIDWGRIIEWEPPYRLAMTWRLDGHWQSIDNDEHASEIEVTFTPVDENTTTVELAHVKLYKHGEGALNIRAALDGPSPGVTLERFANLMNGIPND